MLSVFANGALSPAFGCWRFSCSLRSGLPTAISPIYALKATSRNLFPSPSALRRFGGSSASPSTPELRWWFSFDNFAWLCRSFVRIGSEQNDPPHPLSQSHGPSLRYIRKHHTVARESRNAIYLGSSGRFPPAFHRAPSRYLNDSLRHAP